MNKNNMNCELNYNITETDARDLTPEIEKAFISEAKDLIAYMPVSKDSINYNMSHLRRGKVLIFNNQIFKSSSINLKTREGTEKDKEKLQCVLEKLGFEIEIYDDKTANFIVRKIEKTAQEDHSEADCIMIIVLSHGRNDLIYDANGSLYHVESLWKPFTADKCKTLAGKPKIILTQACRNNNYVNCCIDGIQLEKKLMVESEERNGSETDSSAISESEDEECPNYTIPNLSDFLLVYCTFPGYVSFREPEYGSWFIQSFCKVLEENYTKLDLLSMMTMTSREVALRESKTYNIDTHGKKQVPQIMSTLIRNILFSSKD